MKKTIFALAVTTALGLSAANAETVFYGSIRLGVDYAENHNDYAPLNPAGRNIYTSDEPGWAINGVDADGIIAQPARSADGHYDHSQGTPPSPNDKGFDIVDQSSRLGFHGGEDLGNGLKALYQIEWGFNAAEGTSNGSGFENRLALIGLQSESAGTLVIGRMNNPFEETVYGNATEIMNDDYILSAAAAAGSYVLGGGYTGFGTSAVNYPQNDSLLPTRLGSAVAYFSPDFSGFSFNAAVVMDNGTNNTMFGDARTSVDAWTLNASYKHESGFYAGVGYMVADRVGHRMAPTGSLSVDTDIIGANLGYANDMFGLSAGYASAKGKREVGIDPIGFGYQEADQDADGFDIAGEVYFNDKMTTLRAKYGRMTGTTELFNSPDKHDHRLTTWSVGFEQKLSERTKAWVEYTSNEGKHTYKTPAKSSQYSYDSDRVSVGVRHDF